jgi:hypothetical protein
VRGKPLPSVLVLALAALGAAAGPSAATGPPPTPQPSNQFQLGRARQEGLTVALEATIPDPGRLAASGEQLKKVTVARKRVGTFTVRLKLTAAGLRTLRGSRGHRLKVEVAFVFTPTGGMPRAKTREVTFRARPAPRSR